MSQTDASDESINLLREKLGLSVDLEAEAISTDEKLDTILALVEQVLASQMRVEEMVSKAFENMQPTLNALSKGGILGLFGR